MLGGRARHTLAGRLSWRSLRHSAGAIGLREQGQPITTVSDDGSREPAFTLVLDGVVTRRGRIVTSAVRSNVSSRTCYGNPIYRGFLSCAVQDRTCGRRLRLREGEGGRRVPLPEARCEPDA